MKKFSYLLLLTFLLFSACVNEDDFSSKAEDVSPPRLLNGRLFFSTPQSYLQFISSTIDSDIEKVLDDIQGFKSLRAFNAEKKRPQTDNYKTADDFEELMDDAMDDIVWDPYFENLLNSERELQISDQIYRITEFGTFFYEGDQLKGRMDELQADLVFESRANGRVSSFGCGDAPILVDTDIYYLPGNDCDGYGGYYGATGSSSSTPPPQNGPCGLSTNSKTRTGSSSNIFGVNHTSDLLLTGASDRRIKARFWSQNYAIFSSAGTSTRSQNRFLRIWWAESANDIFLKFKGDIQQKDPFNNLLTFTVESNPPLRQQNQNRIARTFQWASAIIGNSCDPVTGACKPKFKPSSPFKIKKLETCHYVLDEGRHGEIQLLYQ